MFAALGRRAHGTRAIAVASGVWLAATVVLTVASLETHGFGAGGLLGMVMFITIAVGCWFVVRGWRQCHRGLVAAGIALAGSVVTTIVAGSAIEAAQVERTERVGDTIIAALARHRERTGAYPRALAELVPSELPSVPVTRVGVFSREPFRYAADAAGSTFWLHFSLPLFRECGRTPDRGWYVE